MILLAGSLDSRGSWWGTALSEAEEERDATSSVLMQRPHLPCSLLPLPLFYCLLFMPQMEVSGLGDLDLWPMTLTLELDLDISSPDLHTKIQACMSVRLARIVRRTDSHTHRQTMPKLLHPPLTLGVIIIPIPYRRCCCNMTNIYNLGKWAKILLSPDVTRKCKSQRKQRWWKYWR